MFLCMIFVLMFNSSFFFIKHGDSSSFYDWKYKSVHRHIHNVYGLYVYDLSKTYILNGEKKNPLWERTCYLDNINNYVTTNYTCYSTRISPFFLFLIVVCSKMKAIHLKRNSKLWRLDIVLHANCDTCINLELSFLIQIQAYYNYFLTIIIHDWTLIEYSQQRKKVGKYVRKMCGSRGESGGVPDKKKYNRKIYKMIELTDGFDFVIRFDLKNLEKNLVWEIRIKKI